MRQKENGLTLIETMMIVAAIGILATIAVPPAYQLYENSVARQQVNEAMELLDHAKGPVSEFYTEHKRWPEKAEFDHIVGVRNGKYVENVTPHALPDGFQVTAKFKSHGVSPGLLENDSGRTLVLATVNGSKWICNDDPSPSGGVPGLVPGTVLKEHRPDACR